MHSRPNLRLPRAAVAHPTTINQTTGTKAADVYAEPPEFVPKLSPIFHFRRPCGGYVQLE